MRSLHHEPRLPVLVYAMAILALAVPGRATMAAPPTSQVSPQILDGGLPAALPADVDTALPTDLDRALDDPTRAPDASASFYHIPGSALTPVDSTTQLIYDSMGCVHASAGATYLLNAPLEIPSGSRIVLLRTYFDDASASDVSSWITRYNEAGTDFEDIATVPSLGNSGHGSNFVNLDHVVDTYGWSYVLNARLNVASSSLQICGFRVMYYDPFNALQATDPGGSR